MSNLLLHNDEAQPDMDDLLRDYYQAEMPSPWPGFQTPRPARVKQPASFWSRSSGRLALAACVALLIAGYWTLAGYFPQAQTPTGAVPHMKDIGHKPSEKKVQDDALTPKNQ